MKYKQQIISGTALGVLMASSPLSAYTLQNSADLSRQATPLILAQSVCQEGESAEACAARQANEAPASEQPAPPAEPAPAPAPAPEAAPAPAEKAPAEAAPTAEPTPSPSEQAPAAPAPQPPEQPKAPATEQPAATPPAATEPAPQPQAQPEAPAATEQPATTPPPATEPTAPQTEAPATGAPATTEQPAKAGQAPAADASAAPANPDAAPVLDSQKESAPTNGPAPATTGEQTAQPAPAEAGPPPTSDAAATEAAQPKEIESVKSEEGSRRDRSPDEEGRKRERPEGTDVVREIGDRIIVQFGDHITVESNDRPRMTRGAKEVYYEDLPRGRTRETIVRENGNQIVTVRDRYGNVIRRSRITADGREFVMVYVDDQYYRDNNWRDPGLDLPPIRLTIPVNEYILDAADVDDPQRYYTFLDQPPVERIQRLYSLDEVKRSARLRDIVRRVDLDTLTFETGSADIPEGELGKLKGLAEAMEKLLGENPAETFLIEGHTDAVGSDEANLALSDRRAESVASALTNSFAIPPENLVTQGYGEQYLKVKTEEAARENRRVGIRRITPLVAPVASAN
ncbi:OmpA family protein [Mesorhizobium amorphae]